MNPTDRTFIDQVVPIRLHKVTSDVSELLCGGDHMDPLAKKLPSLFLGEVVLTHY